MHFRARFGTLDEEQLHESVNGEWSFAQTLRHLAYATDLWVFRVAQGEPDPYDPLDLPFEGRGGLEVRPALRNAGASVG